MSIFGGKVKPDLLHQLSNPSHESKTFIGRLFPTVITIYIMC